VQNQKDSSGNDGAADSAKYPCPPTAAQQSSGITCGISYGDASGNQASADIHFAGEGGGGGGAAAGSSPNTAGAGGSSGSGSASSLGGSTSASGGSSPTLGSTDSSGATASSGGSLPFTGFGLGLWRLTLLGALLTCVGTALVILGPRPHRWARRAGRSRPGRALLAAYGRVRVRLPSLPVFSNH
jgi:hypothetical protein